MGTTAWRKELKMQGKGRSSRTFLRSLVWVIEDFTVMFDLFWGAYCHHHRLGRVRGVDCGVEPSWIAMQVRDSDDPRGSFRTWICLWVVQNWENLGHYICALTGQSLNVDWPLEEELWLPVRPGISSAARNFQPPKLRTGGWFSPKEGRPGPQHLPQELSEGAYFGVREMLNLVSDILHLGLWQGN